ncbi:MAG: hypothetical protein P3T54_05960 [Dehalogenimonas sp.]|uniref:Terminase large subunit gp17-like C-terminal domain-containing protein n=1 Tax=Candidatus Dehalogenimonas loeffleri TaxID=3127115 RepID=A0ABZ2J5R8_9CHLR|nr:hypothetical protein [Dehalogenimonas sp.]
MTLFPYQREIINAVLDSVLYRRGLTFSVEIARQGGKNELSAWIEAILLNFSAKEPRNIVKCAPTFNPQALISLHRLCGRLDSNESLRDYRIETGNTVRLGEARCIFLSASPPANVVGNTAHLLLEVDEAQDVTIDKFNRDFKPMTAVTNATTVLYGTPWKADTLLGEVKQTNLALEQRDGIKRHFHFDWQVVAACRPFYKAHVENELARLGENHPMFRTQYALLPVSSGGGFLSDTQLMALAGQYPASRMPQPGAVYVAGLDLGGDAAAAADSSVLTIAEINPGAAGDSLVRVVRHYAWTGLPANKLVNSVATVAQTWKLRRLVADATGLGQPLTGLLKQSLGNRVVSFVFTRKTKSELGYEMLAAASTGRLTLYNRDASLDGTECWRQLENAAADYHPDRSMNFYVDPSRGHDDYLISLALTLKAADGYRPRAAFGGR